MFKDRLKILQKGLSSNRIDALLVSSAANIFYLTGIDSFSRVEREAYLFITKSSAMLFTDGRYIEEVRNILPKGAKVFLNTELFKKIKNSKAKRIGIEKNFAVAELKRFKKETGGSFVLTESIIEQIRAVKDEEEVKNIRAACRLADRAYNAVRRVIKIGVSEREVAWKIEKFIKEEGSELAFKSIVAFGPNAAIPHHKTSNKRLSKSDQFILLDFGAKVNGYCCDMTRTLLTKNANTKARKMYETVLAAQQKAIDYLASGSDLLESERPIRSETHGRRPRSRRPEAVAVDRIARNYITSKGFETIPHGLGHGVGIEIHELPRLSPKSKDRLSKGMVFTIEPGVYIPGFGGVRIENDYLFSDKPEQLTESPKELIEIKV